jgi:hypothetical protein
MTALERLGIYLASGQNLPPLALANVRLHLVDTVAAWIAGIATVEGRALLAFRTDMLAGAPDAERPSAALMTHCALARLSEIDESIRRHDHGGRDRGVTGRADARRVAPDNGPAALALAAIASGYDAVIRLGLRAARTDRPLSWHLADLILAPRSAWRRWWRA